LRIVSVQDGYALLRSEGLYQAKVTLTPILNVPDAPSIYKGMGAGHREAVAAGKEVASEAAGGDPAALDRESLGEDDEEDITSGPKPARWLWLMLEFQLLPNSCLRPPLAPPQAMHLLQDLNVRMSLATDAAAYERLRRARQERIAKAAEGQQQQQQQEAGGGLETGADGSCAAPSRPAISGAPSLRTSGTSGAATNSLAASLSVAGGVRVAGMSCRAQTRSYLADMQRYAADEATIPLLTAHCILSDVAMRWVGGGAAECPSVCEGSRTEQGLQGPVANPRIPLLHPL